jgi:uncharacterized protein (DUF4415 family)
MDEKSENTRQTWVDQDDAPELKDDFFEKGIWRIGDRVVPREEGQAAAREALRRGRPRAARRKVSVTVRYDEDIVRAFKAKGPGWQTRMNEALGEWLKAHSG